MLTDLSLVAARDGLRRREFTAAELVGAHLQAVDVLNPQLNAFITVMAEGARAGAAAADTALAAARQAGLVAAEDAATLDDAWVLATRVRNAVMLVRGRAGDTFPSDGRELAAVGRHLGYGPGRVGELVDDYRRTTRRARSVVERLFYGDEDRGPA